MKKHSLYLREDQITFLQNLDNASQFVREALDVAIASQRGSAEKTICLYEATRELETKITAQALLIKTNGKETEEIEEKIRSAQKFLKVAQEVVDGQFQIEQHKGKLRVLAEIEENRYTVVTEGHDTEEEAKTKALEKGKISIENAKHELKKLEEKKQRHEQYVDAQKQKLKSMQKNLEVLQASIK